MSNKKSKVIADISIFPVGVGSSVGDYVRAAFKSMNSVKSVRFKPNAMATIMEGNDLHDIILAVEKAHDAIVKMGAKRVYIMLRIDHRLDKAESARYKLQRIQGKI